MAGFTIKRCAVIVASFGVKAFFDGIFAEHKKHGSGRAVISNGVLTCKYPSYKSIILGFLSIAFLTASAATGFLSVFLPYKGKDVPLRALFHSMTIAVFFPIAVWVTLLAEGMLLWATITQLVHVTKNVHNTEGSCPTAKTGLFGGAAFMALNASIFWLVCLMLAHNAREDYFAEDKEIHNGEYSQVFTTKDETKEQTKI